MISSVVAAVANSICPDNIHGRRNKQNNFIDTGAAAGTCASNKIPTVLIMVFICWLASSCGMLVPVPENTDITPQEVSHFPDIQAPDSIDNYPEDFAHFLDSNNAHADYEEFYYFLKSYDVHEILPAWQLLQQGTDWQRHQLPKYALPNREQWEGMVNTLVFLKYDLIPYIGDVKILSGFRTPNYNLLAGGAGKSRHLTFSALDLRPVEDIDKSQLHNILRDRWASLGRGYNLGLGIYSGSRFHIDTGGYRQW